MAWKVGDRFTKLLSLLRILQRSLVSSLCNTNSQGRDTYSSTVQYLHGLDEPFTLIAEHVRAAGIRQPSKNKQAVSEARMPSLFSFLPPLKPGVPFSTINAVMPRESPFSPVRTITTATSPLMACVIKFLDPFSTHSIAILDGCSVHASSVRTSSGLC